MERLPKEFEEYLEGKEIGYSSIYECYMREDEGYPCTVAELAFYALCYLQEKEIVELAYHGINCDLVSGHALAEVRALSGKGDKDKQIDRLKELERRIEKLECRQHSILVGLNSGSREF